MKRLQRDCSHFLRAISSLLTVMAALTTLLILHAQVTAQSCNHIPQGGGESISADISVAGTGQALNEDWLVAPNTSVNINALATATGQCIGMGWNCQQSPCVCQENGFIYERTVNHISVSVDASSTILNGTYPLGNVYGKNPDGTTADFHVLDTRASNSTGPINFLLAYPGVYTFRIKGFINQTLCNMQPTETNEISITLVVGLSTNAPIAARQNVRQTSATR